MRRFIHCVALALLLAMGCVGCVTNGELEQSYMGYDQGALSLQFNLTQVEAETGVQVDIEEVLESAVLRVEQSNGTLVRRYEPASQMPESLYMLSGSYVAKITLGNNIYATFNAAERSFSGSESFAIVAGEVAQVELECELQSATIEVVFDPTIAATFAEGYSITISNGVAELTYSAATAAKGYFTVPDGATTFSYEFNATSKVTGEEVVMKGTMSAPKAREEHKITLKYSTYLDISSVKVSLDTEGSDDVDDSLGFSPQPTISGVGFDINFMQPADGRDYQFSVTSIKTLSSVAVEFAGVTTTLFGDSATASEWFEYEAVSSSNGILTLKHSAFAALNYGGENAISFTMVDDSGVAGVGKASFNVTGVTAPTNVDLWSCSATLRAQVVVANGGSIEIAYRAEGDTNWTKGTATKVDETTYEVVAAPTWSSATNEHGNTIYSANGGIRTGATYDYMLIVDGQEYAATSFTVEDRRQAIPYADMSNSSLSCFGSSNDSSTTWASGNNTFVSGLCSHGTIGGESVAALTAKAAVGNFAAGNIAFGQFKFNGIVAQTGTLGFGQAFDWEARPTSFKVRYAATIGTANYTDSSILPSGSIDQGRIYVAVVDWSERRSVTSGSGSPSGVWDPAKDMELDEGRIIGYGSTFISESTTTDELHDLEIPIVYYDYVTKPSNNITLVISAVTSAYGDYMVGSTDNRMWVKDFEFGY
ncbi:MAG: DUF4493 domain-containing protein [Rikenellaceae bacterium]